MTSLTFCDPLIFNRFYQGKTLREGLHIPIRSFIFFLKSHRKGNPLHVPWRPTHLAGRDQSLRLDVEPEWNHEELWLLRNTIGSTKAEQAMALNVDNVVVYDLSQMWTEHTTEDMLQGSESRVRLPGSQSIQDETVKYNAEARERERKDREEQANRELARILLPDRAI